MMAYGRAMLALLHNGPLEKIMSKTNETPRSATIEDHRSLADSELDAVSGGKQRYRRHR
jgi:hypothetical protein